MRTRPAIDDEDHEISDFVYKNFLSRGVKIFTEAVITDIAINKSVKCKINLNSNVTEIIADKILLAVGVEANIKNIGGKVQELQRKPQGDPNPTLRSACVDLDNKNKYCC